MHKDQLNLTVAHYGLKKAVRFYKVIDWINQIGRIVACVLFFTSALVSFGLG